MISVIQPNSFSQEETKEESPISQQQFDRKIKLVQSFHDSYEVTFKEVKAAIETLNQGQSSYAISFQTLLNETTTKQATKSQADLNSVSDALKTQLQELKASIDSLGNQSRSDLTKNQENFKQEILKLQESVKSQIKQKSDEIASMTQKYGGQLTHLKNQTEESARAITLDIAQRLTDTEYKFIKL